MRAGTISHHIPVYVQISFLLHHPPQSPAHHWAGERRSLAAIDQTHDNVLLCPNLGCFVLRDFLGGVVDSALNVVDQHFKGVLLSRDHDYFRHLQSPVSLCFFSHQQKQYLINYLKCQPNLPRNCSAL